MIRMATEFGSCAATSSGMGRARGGSTTEMDSAVRYLGVEREDALAISEAVEI